MPAVAGEQEPGTVAREGPQGRVGDRCEQRPHEVEAPPPSATGPARQPPHASAGRASAGLGSPGHRPCPTSRRAPARTHRRPGERRRTASRSAPGRGATAPSCRLDARDRAPPAHGARRSPCSSSRKGLDRRRGRGEWVERAERVVHEAGMHVLVALERHRPPRTPPSRSRTDQPASTSRLAATSPFGPAPTTTASYDDTTVHPLRSANHVKRRKASRLRHSRAGPRTGAGTSLAGPLTTSSSIRIRVSAP